MMNVQGIQGIHASSNGAGTSLQGYVEATYLELEAAFGPPHQVGGDKTTVEWTFDLELIDGNTGDESTITVTIYDWRTGSTPTGKYQWHIGGFCWDGSLGADMIDEMLRRHRAGHNMLDEEAGNEQYETAFEDATPDERIDDAIDDIVGALDSADSVMQDWFSQLGVLKTPSSYRVYGFYNKLRELEEEITDYLEEQKTA